MVINLTWLHVSLTLEHCVLYYYSIRISYYSRILQTIYNNIHLKSASIIALYTHATYM